MGDAEELTQRLPTTYAACEVIVASLAVAGNSCVVLVFGLEKRLRRSTNLYIVSLAVSDLLVGLVGVPSALLTRAGKPRDAFRPCLLMLSALVLLCTVSILNLVAVTLDRYWAILHPFCYRRRGGGKKSACAAIAACWILGTLVGLLPLMGWNNGPHPAGLCLFIPVMSYDFLVMIFFATIVYPALLMAFCYGRIYAVVLKQLRQFPSQEQQRRHLSRDCSSIRDSAFTSSSMRDGSPTSSERSLHLHLVVRQQRTQQPTTSSREVRTAKNLAVIVGFFIMCWMPLHTVNCVQAFCHGCTAPPWLLDAFIVLSHTSSALNPFLYAYHMSDFRSALRKQLCRLCCCCFRARSPFSSCRADKQDKTAEGVENLSAQALGKMADSMSEQKFSDLR